MLRLHDEELIVSDDCFKKLQRHRAVLVAAHVAGHQLRIQGQKSQNHRKSSSADIEQNTCKQSHVTDRPHHVLQSARLRRVPGEMSAVRRWQGLAEHVEEPDGHLHLHERSRLPAPEETSTTQHELLEDDWNETITGSGALLVLQV